MSNLRLPTTWILVVEQNSSNLGDLEKRDTSKLNKGIPLGPSGLRSSALSECQDLNRKQRMGSALVHSILAADERLDDDRVIAWPLDLPF